MLKRYNHEYVTLFLSILLMAVIPLQKIFIYTLNYLKITRNLYTIHIAYALWGIGFLFLVNYLISIVFKKIKLEKSDYIIFILSILTIIATFFTIHMHKSLYGEINRFEGLYSLLTYYIAFLNLKNLKSEDIKKLIINLFIIVGIVGVTYSILQVFTNLEFIRKFSKPYMAHGLSGNPNFFGSLTVMIVTLSSAYYLLTNNIKYLVLSGYFMIGLTLSNSTGPIIALFIALLYFFIIKKINIKKIIILSVLLFSVFISINEINNYIQKKNDVWINPNFNTQAEIKAITNKEKTFDNFGNGRLKIWENSLPALKKYGAFGSGPDTFAIVYPQIKGLIYDKAHNVYLQMAITTGIPSVIVYLLLCLITVVYGMFDKNTISSCLNITFIVYSIQAFANISVIEVAPYFFIIWGLNYSYYNNKEDFVS